VFVVIIEHLWARELRNALVDTGGFHLADEWLHPSDLAEIGYFDTPQPPEQPRATGIGIDLSQL
jgi:hypothetical protein